MEVSVAKVLGFCLNFSRQGWGLSACRIKKHHLEIRHQMWATREAKSGSSSLPPSPGLHFSSSQGNLGQGKLWG